MKIQLTIAAALLAATAAVAQTSPGPAQSTTQQPDSAGMSAPSTTSPNGNLSGGTYDASQPPAAGTTAMAEDGLVQRDGKWYSGDRPATKAEIKAHKAAMKKPS